MNLKIQSALVAAAVFAACSLPVHAADKAPRRSVECEASKSPDAKSTGNRADVKAEAKAAARAQVTGCDAPDGSQPMPTSTGKRADTRKEGVAAAKAGQTPKGEAGITK